MNDQKYFTLITVLFPYNTASTEHFWIKYVLMINIYEILFIINYPHLILKILFAVVVL